jgi:hypothetical protein
MGAEYLAVAVWALAVAGVLMAVGLFWLGLQIRFAAAHLGKPR